MFTYVATYTRKMDELGLPRHHTIEKRVVAVRSKSTQHGDNIQYGAGQA